MVACPAPRLSAASLRDCGLLCEFPFEACLGSITLVACHEGSVSVACHGGSVSVACPARTVWVAHRGTPAVGALFSGLPCERFLLGGPQWELCLGGVPCELCFGGLQRHLYLPDLPLELGPGGLVVAVARAWQQLSRPKIPKCRMSFGRSFRVSPGRAKGPAAFYFFPSLMSFDRAGGSCWWALLSAVVDACEGC